MFDNHNALRFMPLRRTLQELTDMPAGSQQQRRLGAGLLEQPEDRVGVIAVAKQRRQHEVPPHFPHEIRDTADLRRVDRSNLMRDHVPRAARRRHHRPEGRDRGAEACLADRV